MSPGKVWQHVVWLVLLVPLAIVLVVLFGCAQNPPAPPVVSGIKTVEPIKVPVLVPCLTKEQIPAPPPSFMNPTLGGWHNEVAAAIDLKQLDEYMVRSQTLLWGCVKTFDEPEKKP